MQQSSLSSSPRRAAGAPDPSTVDVRLAAGIDDALLVELGFEAMPAKDRRELAAGLQEELEARVGHTLAARLDEERLDEFERLISGDAALGRHWLAAHARPGDEARMAVFAASRQAADPLPDPLLAEWASLRWLEESCPDYRDVVAAALAGIRAELLAYRDRLLAASD